MKTRLNSVLQLSWLERYTDNVEVGSSTLPGTTEVERQWGISSAGQSTCFARRGSTVRIRYSPLRAIHNSEFIIHNYNEEFIIQNYGERKEKEDIDILEAKSATTNSDEVPQGMESEKVVKDRTRANQNKVTQSMEPGSIKADREQR